MSVVDIIVSQEKSEYGGCSFCCCPDPEDEWVTQMRIAGLTLRVCKEHSTDLGSQLVLLGGKLIGIRTSNAT